MKEIIRQYWKIALCFLGVFLAGGVVGGMLTATVVRQAVVRRLNPQNWDKLVLRAMDRNLNLSPEQRAKIEPMVAAAVTDWRAEHAEAVSHYRQTWQQLKTNVNTVLDPEQQKKLEALAQERQRRLQKLLGRE